MNEKQVKDKVWAVLSLMKPEWKWAAFDSRGTWWAHMDEPKISGGSWMTRRFVSLSHFDLTNPTDWRDSLVER